MAPKDAVDRIHRKVPEEARAPKESRVSKDEKAPEEDLEDAEKRQQILEEAEKVVIKEDTSLPKPICVRLNVTDPAIVKLGSPQVGDTWNPCACAGPDTLLAF